ncbi:MAG: glycosyltransferase family 39 protein [Bryobacteraceae bacterium]
MPANPALAKTRHGEELRRLAYWLVPSLFCLALYYYGIRAWYQQDDFVWLAQRYDIHNLHDFLRAVFHPAPHGTWRPLSERLFFLVCGSLFGTSAFPARLCVFLTQLANLVLLSSIARRLSGSRVAGFLAPVLWTANSALVLPMTWTSPYMEILCAFCILSAFYCFLRYVEAGRRSWYYGQWAAFLIGFGVMETTIVYPAIAAAYALLWARKHVRHTLPLFGVSLLFFGFHTWFAPKQHTGIYSQHFDARMLKTVAIYWKWVLVPPGRGWPPFLVMLTVVAMVYIAWSAWRRNLLPLFGLICFGLLLAPVAPLTEHMTPYYLTLPAIGIALVGASGAAAAAGKGWPQKIVAAAVLSLFLIGQAPVAARQCRWWSARSRRMERIVLGVLAVHRQFPGKTLVLTGVDAVFFSGAVWFRAFPAFGVPDTYVDADDRGKIPPDPLLVDSSRYFMDPFDLQQGLLGERVRVLSVAGPVPVDVTPRFEALAKASALIGPRRIDLATVRSQPYLVGEWYESEGKHRWMGRSAGVVLAGPELPAESLHLRGYCPAAQVKSGPLAGRVTADGRLIGTFSLSRGDADFEIAFSLPPGAVGKPSIRVEIQLDHTIRVPDDDRDLGLSFGSFEIR